MNKKITISAIITADSKKVWDYYTNPTHIIHWNFADPSWHCPTASNEMKVGGTYKARMEAKDCSFGFDFEAIYSDIFIGKEFTYDFGGRTVNVTFVRLDNQTKIVVVFDPENENSIEIQKGGWQAILDNFKKYVETN